VVSGIGCLSGCAADEPVPAPTLVWVDGEPDGPLESDPWVRAVRAGSLAEVVALNSADFSGEDLLVTWDRFRIRSFANDVRGDAMHGRAEVFLGPRPFTPLTVETTEDGRRAEVVGCADAFEKVQEVPRSDGNRWPMVLTYFMDLSEDGHRRIRGAGAYATPYPLPDGTALTVEHCDTVLIKRAVLDPPPDLGTLAAKSRDDVVLPPSPSPTPGS